MSHLGRDVARLAHLVRTLAHHGSAFFIARRWPRLARRWSPAGPDPARRLRVWLEQMGGSFVKLGQMLALQPDLVPPAYCRALQDLLDRVPPFSFEKVRQTLREETGREPEEIFDRIEPEPLATASVAQVHVAWLGGQKVAVKVQRPTAAEEFGSDIRWVKALLGLIRGLRLKRFFWLLEPLGEFTTWTLEELDFRCEARYTQQLGRYAEHSAIQVVPRVHDHLTSGRLLVVDFLDGMVLLDYLRAGELEDRQLQRQMEPAGFDRRRVAANIIDTFIHDAFENGIYHADLHPANLLILENSVIGYIDFGITGVMNRHAREQLVSMTLGLVTGDMDSLHRRFLELAAPDPRADPAGFRAGLDRLAAAWYTPGERSLRVNFTRIMTDMLTLSRRTHVLPERDIVKYIRSSIAIDGLITRFAPGFDVGGHLAERCRAQWLRQQRRARLSMPRWLDLAAAGNRLLVDGPDRLLRLLDKLEHETAAGETGESSRQTASATGRRSALLAMSMAGVAIAAVLWQPPATSPGFNLWTAQLLYLATAGLLLARGAFRAAAAPADKIYAKR